MSAVLPNESMSDATAAADETFTSRKKPSRAAAVTWKTLSVISALTLTGLGAWQGSSIYQLSLQKELLSEAMVLSQRMAWASNLVLSEDQNALSSLKESKSRISLLLITLQHGGRIDGQSVAPLIAPLQPLAVEINKIWQPLENATTSVLEGEPVAANDPRFKTIRVGLDQATLTLEKLIAERRHLSPKDVNELSAMDDLLFSLQAVSQVLSLTEPGSRPITIDVDPERIVQSLSLSQAVIDRLMNGNRDANFRPATESERQRLLSLRNDLAVALKTADEVSPLLPKLSANIQASRLVGKLSEALRIQLSMTKRKLSDPLEIPRWAGLMAALILLMLSNRMSQHLLHRELRQQVEQANEALKPSLTNASSDSKTSTSMAVSVSDTGQLMDDAYLKQESPPANESTNVALRGVIAALQQLAQNTAMAVEQSNQTVNAQTEALRANAQIVLQLAHAFHNISTETTGVAKTALKSQQKLGEHHQSANEAVGHWEDVRGQLMKTASNLRKAGEASRLLSQAITALPKDQKTGIAELMTQTREALRDAVGGLAESTAQLNYGEKQAKDVSKALGDTQQQWIELLNRIEVCAGTASAHTQTALGVSKNLSRAASPGVKLLEPGKQG